MSLLFNKRLILLKLGAGSYPDDPLPAAATDALLVRDLAFEPFQGATETLDYIRPTLGAGVEIYTGPHGRVTFTVDLSGSGTAGTAPAWGSAMRMCGFAETVAALTSVEYAPVSSGFEWGAIYFNIDGELHKLQGCRGTVTANFNKEASPSLDFEFWGLWDQTPTAVAAGTPDFDAFIDPIPVNAANTPTLTVDSFATLAESLVFNAGQQVEYRNVIGSESVLITDRDASGSMTIEKTVLADKDFYAVTRSNAIVPINLVHGTVAGNIIEVDARAQLKMQADTDSQGVAVTPFNLRLIPTDAGGDELVITVR